jgi:hypothetical protein
MRDDDGRGSVPLRDISVPLKREPTPCTDRGRGIDKTIILRMSDDDGRFVVVIGCLWAIRVA